MLEPIFSPIHIKSSATGSACKSSAGNYSVGWGFSVWTTSILADSFSVDSGFSLSFADSCPQLIEDITLAAEVEAV